MGTDSKFVCTTKATETTEATAASVAATSAQSNSDIESEDDDEVTEGRWMVTLSYSIFGLYHTPSLDSIVLHLWTLSCSSFGLATGVDCLKWV